MGADPAPIAAAARAAGIVIYCIGLIGSDGIDVSVLDNWATDPDSTHVAVTPDAQDLETLFANLAANISKTGATNIVINEKVMPDFQIVSVNPPNKGSAMTLNSQTLQWKIAALGVSGSEGAVLEFSSGTLARAAAQRLSTSPSLTRIRKGMWYTSRRPLSMWNAALWYTRSHVRNR